jgi:rfaE bifunctional protein nucleotidyltransferase chain/domain
MSAGPLVVVGDALLDRDVEGHAARLCPDAPAPVVERDRVRARPGGAALAALLAASCTDDVVLIAPLGDDPASRTVLSLLPSAVTVIGLPLDGALQEKTRVMASGRTLLRLDSPAATPTGGRAEAVAAIATAGAVLVSDYGHGTAALPAIRDALAARSGPVVWDPHPRGATPVPGTTLVTPNEAEARAAAGEPTAPGEPAPATATLATPPGRSESASPGKPAPSPLRGTAEMADALLARWKARAVCVTLGARGALLARPGLAPLAVPAAAIRVGDPCGAGDMFAAAAAAVLRDGGVLSEAVPHAVAESGRFLAAGGVATLTDTDPAATETGFTDTAFTGTGHAETAPAIKGTGHADTTSASTETGFTDTAPAGTALSRTRPALARAGGAKAAPAKHPGGTLVAAGGCFDVLHAGHVSMLRAARALGDRLVVCLNSDASVRRLKGPWRPINSEGDRASVLRALDCVDEVVVFGEDTPERVLDELRPGIWVKGGDYDGRDLAEAAVLRRWGGLAVTVPYLEGRSTTRIASYIRNLTLQT